MLVNFPSIGGANSLKREERLNRIIEAFNNCDENGQAMLALFADAIEAVYNADKKKLLSTSTEKKMEMLFAAYQTATTYTIITGKRSDPR